MCYTEGRHIEYNRRLYTQMLNFKKAFYHNYMGPRWCNKDGSERKIDVPEGVWALFDEWYKNI